MEKFDAGTFYPKRFDEKSQELSKILIESFKDLNDRDRALLSNNTFMVSLQVRQKYGDEIVEKMKTFNDENWRCAWILFNNHFYQEDMD